ncbi:cytochrome P450 [Babesia caballi]|uniref:Cytochrome P450 n=1 Tax=Babesia caballi TaxID=5871 RepID=A0AAV4LU10_BABCB|nr:cytochrome P450 [Babesia caballi]
MIVNAGCIHRNGPTHARSAHTKAPGHGHRVQQPRPHLRLAAVRRQPQQIRAGGHGRHVAGVGVAGDAEGRVQLPEPHQGRPLARGRKPKERALLFVVELLLQHSWSAGLRATYQDLPEPNHHLRRRRVAAATVALEVREVVDELLEVQLRDLDVFTAVGDLRLRRVPERRHRRRKGEPQRRDLLSRHLAQADEVAVELRVEVLQIVEGVPSPQDEVQQYVREHRLHKDVLVERLPDDLPDEVEDQQVVVVRDVGVGGRREGAVVRRLLEDAVGGVEYDPAERNEELLEEPATVHPLLADPRFIHENHANNPLELRPGERRKGGHPVFDDVRPSDHVGHHVVH